MNLEVKSRSQQHGGLKGREGRAVLIFYSAEHLPVLKHVLISVSHCPARAAPGQAARDLRSWIDDKGQRSVACAPGRKRECRTRQGSTPGTDFCLWINKMVLIFQDEQEVCFWMHRSWPPDQGSSLPIRSSRSPLATQQVQAQPWIHKTVWKTTPFPLVLECLMVYISFLDSWAVSCGHGIEFSAVNWHVCFSWPLMSPVCPRSGILRHYLILPFSLLISGNNF